MLARKSILSLTLIGVAATLGAGPATSAERFLVYKVERIAPEQAPQIDGRLDDPVWTGRNAISTLRNFLGPLRGEFASQRSEFVLLCDGAMLYLGITFHDEEMSRIMFNPAKPPFWNDCAEIYFDPRHDGARNIQLVVDCGGQKFWHKMFDDGYGWWPDSSWHLLAKWDAAVVRHGDRWTVELAIDCASFGIDPTPGKVCGFNPCRFRLGAQQPEFSAWGFSAGGAQKDMAAWGHLLFTPPGADRQAAAVTRDDVALIYPELGDRVLEVPAADGFQVFDRNGERRETFRERLDPLLAVLQQSRDEAVAALAALREDDPNRQGLTATLDQARAEADRLIALAAEPELTLGRYDQLADGLGKTADLLVQTSWKIKISALAFPGR